MDNFKDELNELHSDTIDKVVELADKYGLDRDDVMRQFSTVIFEFSCLATLRNYKKEENNSDN